MYNEAIVKLNYNNTKQYAQYASPNFNKLDEDSNRATFLVTASDPNNAYYDNKKGLSAVVSDMFAQLEVLGEWNGQPVADISGINNMNPKIDPETNAPQVCYSTLAVKYSGNLIG